MVLCPAQVDYPSADLHSIELRESILGAGIINVLAETEST